MNNEKPQIQKENYIFLDGEFLKAEEAKLSVEDRAVLFGESVFETIRCYSGKPFRLPRHLERLKNGCKILRLQIPLHEEKIKEASYSLISKNGLSESDAYLRITVTGGRSTGRTGLERQSKPSIFIIAKPFEGYEVSLYKKGVKLAVSGIRRNSTSPLSYLKTGNYLDSLLARQEAKDRRADDSVMLTTAGNIAEATSSNIFMVKDGVVLTPDLGCGLLPGITRDTVLEICSEIGIYVRAITEGIETLLTSDEVFLTNSLMEVMPVRSVGSKEYKPCPGKITLRIMQAYRELVERELNPSSSLY